MTSSTTAAVRGLEPLGGHVPNRGRPRQAARPATALACANGRRRVTGGGVRFPPETVGAVGQDGCMETMTGAPLPGRGVLLPRGEVARPSLRRGLLHRGADHRHLLPPVLPGPHAGVPQRHLPPERRLGPGRRLPRLQALPARRHPGQPRLGRRRDGGRPRHAADRRRGRRPRGRRRAGPPGRLHAATPHPAAHRRARRRPAGAGPGPSRADRAGARRDHRPRLRRRRVRRRASPASGSSTTPSARSTPRRPPSCAAGAAAARRPRAR